MEGYTSTPAIPQYRRIRATLAMHSNSHIPAGFGYGVRGMQELHGFGVNPEIPVPDSISTVMSWIESIGRGNGIYNALDRTEELDGLLRRNFHPMIRNQVDFMLHLNDCQVLAIPDQIKDKVLGWACALEEAGVKGEGQSFSAEERQVAHSVQINISGSQIEQLNNSGNNYKG